MILVNTDLGPDDFYALVWRKEGELRSYPSIFSIQRDTLLADQVDLVHGLFMARCAFDVRQEGIKAFENFFNQALQESSSSLKQATLGRAAKNVLDLAFTLHNSAAWAELYKFFKRFTNLTTFQAVLDDYTKKLSTTDGKLYRSCMEKVQTSKEADNAFEFQLKSSTLVLNTDQFSGLVSCDLAQCRPERLPELAKIANGSQAHKSKFDTAIANHFILLGNHVHNQTPSRPALGPAWKRRLEMIDKMCVHSQWEKALMGAMEFTAENIKDVGALSARDVYKALVAFPNLYAMWNTAVRLKTQNISADKTLQTGSGMGYAGPCRRDLAS